MAKWGEIQKEAFNKITVLDLDNIYVDRLKFEISEIDKQGAQAIWCNYFDDNKKFASNPNHLVLPWLLGMVSEDPIKSRRDPMLLSTRASDVIDFKNKHGYIPSDILKDSDMPDIDIDCLPAARDPIKDYAMKKYNNNSDDEYGYVCSVGTWTTYKFKSALADAHSVLASSIEDKKLRKSEVIKITRDLPTDIDAMREDGKSVCKGLVVADNGEERECGFEHNRHLCPKCGSGDTESPTIGSVLLENPELMQFAREYPESVQYAVQLVGRVRNMGMHAGALIISDRPLYGDVPLAMGNKGYWVSMWSEGRNTQLSKFGYIKYDILGLTTLEYLYNCCKLIRQNRGITFGDPSSTYLPMEGWDDVDPRISRGGYYHGPDGTKYAFDLNDKETLELANKQLVDGVFQFDTSLAKQILQNGVRTFNDLLLFNAMGHPGPMQCCCPHSKINTDMGHVEIRNLRQDKHKIYSMATDGRLIKTSKYDVVKSGRKKMLNIRLKDGRVIKVSHDHKIMTKNGYKDAGSLSAGEAVAIL